MKRQKRVVIVGGGFGGIKAAMELARHHDFLITLITDKLDFNYYPALFHTATGGSHHVSTIPIGELTARKPIEVIHGEATKLDRSKKTIMLKSRKKISYDTLILSLGVVTNYFGIKGLEENCHTVKSIEKAEALKDYLQQQLIDSRKPDLNYVVVGGGPTGIEFASMLPVYLRELLDKYNLGRKAIRVELIEAKPQLLPMMPKNVGRIVKKRLSKLGVKVITGATVDGETHDALIVDGKPIQSRTVIWTAGVTNHPFFAKNDFQLSQRGKVVVDDYLSVGDDIFVIGDNAETQYSGMAQTALHDAVYVAHSLVREHHDQPPIAYQPKKPVYIIPVGPKWAVVMWGRMKFFGWLGWILRIGADWRGYKDFEPWWKATGRTVAFAIDED